MAKTISDPFFCETNLTDDVLQVATHFGLYVGLIVYTAIGAKVGGIFSTITISLIMSILSLFAILPFSVTVALT